MNKTWLGIVVWAVMMTLSPAEDICNPQAAEGDFVLPMPGGLTMTFRPVYLGVGDAPFAAREFKVGDRAGGGFKEYPTVVVLGGGFRAERQGPKDWCYYLGKYEVNEAQYEAVVKPGSTNQSVLPARGVSWFEVQDFIHRYNLWLFENAREKLPRNEESCGFLRLPTEAEWEFAARGGIAVSADFFDRAHPYPRELSRYEWFSGPSSSYDKIKKTGRLLPNELGLFDMLGNVSEMADSLYQIEYYQGRCGGFVARGGNFRTPEKKLRSSMRSEQPFYTSDLKPFRQEELGFRLAISSPIYAGRQTAQVLEGAWEDYRKTRPTPGTALASISPTSTRTSFQLNDAIQSLARLESSLKASAAPEEALNQLGLLKASFGDIESLILKAEADSAGAWTKMAAYTAWFLWREIKKTPAWEENMKVAEQVDTPDELEIQRRNYNNWLANIRDAAAQYGLVMGELDKLDRAAVLKGFGEYEKRLIGLGLAEQIRVNQAAIRHYEEFAGSKRLNMEKWKEELGKL